MKPIQPVLLAATLLASMLPGMGQERHISPHETFSSVINGDRVTIVYGRPYTKNPRTGEERKIWGGLVPYGRVWRLGADESTLLITQKPLAFGDTTVPAGAYSLYMLPEENGASKLIINKQIGQWGTQYDEGQDLARVDMKKETFEKNVPQLTMAITKNPEGGGILKVMWETTQYSIPFTVK